MLRDISFVGLKLLLNFDWVVQEGLIQKGVQFSLISDIFIGRCTIYRCTPDIWRTKI